LKQNVLSFLSTIKEEILNINKFLYETSENCFNEYKSSDYIIKLLEKYNFNIERNFLDIPTAFRARIGHNNPEICLICKYSSGSDDGHVFGNNANATMSLGAAIGLSSIIDKIGGSILVVGCPGKYSNGSEIIMTKEGIFENCSAIFAPHADNITSINSTSQACSTLQLDYDNLLISNDNANQSSLDVCLHTVHFINQLIKNISKYCYMDHLNLTCDNALSEYPSSAKVKFEIKSKNYKLCNKIEQDVRNYIKCIEDIINITCSIKLVELPCKELLDNELVNKLFENNLKESGLIEMNYGKKMLYPLGIGTVSHTTPTIYPSISIVSDSSIHCPSKEFRDSTLTEYAQCNIWKGIEALTLTALDLIEREDLIYESTTLLSKNIPKYL
jgi:metal-dependent amidase/aminoacylase/carboxypeptidase family protein